MLFYFTMIHDREQKTSERRAIQLVVNDEGQLMAVLKEKMNIVPEGSDDELKTAREPFNKRSANSRIILESLNGVAFLVIW